MLPCMKSSRKALLLLAGVALRLATPASAFSESDLDGKWVPGQRIGSIVFGSPLPDELSNREVEPRFTVRLSHGGFVRGLVTDSGDVWCLATRSREITYRGVRVGTSRRDAQRRLGRRFTFRRFPPSRSVLAFYDAAGERITTLYMTGRTARLRDPDRVCQRRRLLSRLALRRGLTVRLRPFRPRLVPTERQIERAASLLSFPS